MTHRQKASVASHEIERNRNYAVEHDIVDHAQEIAAADDEGQDEHENGDGRSRKPRIDRLATEHELFHGSLDLFRGFDAEDARRLEDQHENEHRVGNGIAIA